MDLREIPISELYTLSQDEVICEFKKLRTKYDQVKETAESDQQIIYELRRNLDTAIAAEAFLTQELEQLTASQKEDLEKIQRRHNHDMQVLKSKWVEIGGYNSALEQKTEQLLTENQELHKKVEELETTEPIDISTTSGNLEKDELEKENLNLLAKVDEFQVKLNNSVLAAAERQRQIEILNEQVDCLKESLQSKREELEEKNQLLESTQEHMVEMATELNVLKAQPDNANRKGNSLFAEVDDQRQQMKTILTAQKKHYIQMKKCYNESEQEIRRLKRENAAMHKEIQTCTSIFLNADKLYKEKLNERILQLLKQNEELEKKINWTQSKLIALSNEKGINWLDSMFNFCKNETQELKEQLRSCRMQKCILEESLQKSQQELAKWRFEALKSRCVIINRETLLEENKILFEPLSSFDSYTPENNLPAKPRILFSRQEDDKTPDIDIKQEIFHEPLNSSLNTNDIIDLKDLTTVIKMEKQEEPTASSSKYHLDNVKIETDLITSNNSDSLITNKINFDIYEDTATNELTIKNHKTIQEGTTEDSMQAHGSGININNERTSNNYFEIYEDTTQILPTTKDIESKVLQLSEESNNKELKLENKENLAANNNFDRHPTSILVKKRDILDDSNDNKTVKFSDPLDSPKKTCETEAKRQRTKVNVIVKRIVVKSKFSKE